MRALGRCPVKHLAMAQSVRWVKRFACAIRSTGSSCRGSHVLCAVERRRTRITSRLSNSAHLDTESATSSLSQSVGFITASCIAVVTRSPGGTRSTSILFQSRSGSGSTLGSMASSPWQAEASCGRRMRRHRTFHLKIEPVRTPINALMQRALCPKMPTGSRADDLLSTDRGQSTQCAREHHLDNGVFERLDAAAALLLGAMVQCGAYLYLSFPQDLLLISYERREQIRDDPA